MDIEGEFFIEALRVSQCFAKYGKRTTISLGNAEGDRFNTLFKIARGNIVDNLEVQN